jgi:hypothetical protein
MATIPYIDTAVNSEIDEAEEKVVSINSARASVKGTDIKLRESTTLWIDPDTTYLDRKTVRAPKFPLDVFTPSWEQWIIDVAKAYATEVDFVACALLCVMGAVMGNRYWPQVHEKYKEPPVTWMALVGEPSVNKSGALNELFAILLKLVKDMRDEESSLIRERRKDVRYAEAQHEKWESDCEKAAKAGLPFKDEEPVIPNEYQEVTLLVGDSTPEKMTIDAEDQPGGQLVYEDELWAWYGRFDQYKRGGSTAERSVWIKAHGGK